MAELNLSKAEFIKSAAAPEQFISSSLSNVVFAGKSNVGKSSVINRLLNRNNFARVGATPGKTVHVNYFLIGDKVYFIDLPGYGFAKVPEQEKIRWSKLMERFFTDTQISVGILVVDSRHKPTEDDINMSNLFSQNGCEFAVLANKIDKLKKTEVETNIAMIRQTLKLGESTPVIPFSAEKGAGRNELISFIYSTL